MLTISRAPWLSLLATHFPPDGVTLLLLLCILWCMRTNIDIDDTVLKEVQRLTGAKTKREAVDVALRELVARYRRLGLLRLKGKVRWEGDLEVSRTGRT